MTSTAKRIGRGHIVFCSGGKRIVVPEATIVVDERECVINGYGVDQLDIEAVIKLLSDKDITECTRRG